jgi:hypothetical protein
MIGHSITIFFASLCACISSVVAYTDEAVNDMVFTIPRASEFNFKFFSGYLSIPTHKNIHYLYAESQNDPVNDPLVFFISGGPVCSGLVAFFTEMGPWKPVRNGDVWSIDLVPNPYSWNKMANVVFVEQPVGVGFSYSESSHAEFSDVISADDNFHTLLAFFNRFPERRHNDFHLSSEAYGGGHFVPQLADVILTSHNLPLINQFKGIIVGSPFVSFGTGVVARAHALWGYQLIPRSLWKTFVETGCSSMDARYENYSPECGILLERLFEVTGPHLDNGMKQNVCMPHPMFLCLVVLNLLKDMCA